MSCVLGILFGKAALSTKLGTTSGMALGILFCKAASVAMSTNLGTTSGMVPIRGTSGTITFAKSPVVGGTELTWFPVSSAA
jgi:hypothetical protein